MLTDAQALVPWPELQREKETSGLEVGGAQAQPPPQAKGPETRLTHCTAQSQANDSDATNSGFH